MSRAYKIPDLKFEDQNLTSFAGLVIFQPLVLGLEIKNRLWHCFRHLNFSRIFGHHIITMLLIVHLLLGYRRLRDLSYYQDDPMVKRLLGLNQLPDASTVSRALSSIDGLSIERLRALCRNLVIERLKKMAIYRITLDFDGSVFSTQSRTTEGTAVGYNRKRKGARSYYPLFCTLAQTGQVFDVYQGATVGADRIAYGVRLTFRSSDGTLTDGEVDAIVARIVTKLDAELGVALRS
jgi:hypothetical protein